MVPLLLALQLATPALPNSRIGRLQVWLDAVEAHEPGAYDAAAATVRAMSGDVLDRARIDLRAVIALMSDPRQNIFYGEPPPNAHASMLKPIAYGGAELGQLRVLARDAATRGSGVRILKRAALLHADLAMLEDREGSPTNARGADRMERITAWVNDGQQVRLLSSVDHLEMGRKLLRRCSDPNAGNQAACFDPGLDDGDVLLWYQSMTAFLLGVVSYQLPQFDAALTLFPLDPTILFLVGCMREGLANPATNWSLRSARGVSLDIGSTEDELRKAEALYRRALAVDAGHVEARLRLGRVLGLLGRSAAASKELAAAIGSTRDPLLLYYGVMFLGRELELQGDVNTASAAYEKARVLAPAAPSPRLALSQIAGRSGLRQAALSLIREAVGPAAVREDDEPLWMYHAAAGRGAGALTAEMRRRLANAK